MSATLRKCRVFILVKALPRRSARHGETVCCAGITSQGEFRRLYPIRFRHLEDNAAFKRWDEVEFKYERPLRDRRAESCRVVEESISRVGKMLPSRRARFLNRFVARSVAEAAEDGKSLALIRPSNTQFRYKKKSTRQIETERRNYREAAQQTSFIDKELEELKPAPYEFYFHFDDATGRHRYANADWEAHAMFYHECRRKDSEQAALDWMDKTFNEDYPRKGMLFCVGNIARRPQTWQLLGVLRVDETEQASLL